MNVAALPPRTLGFTIDAFLDLQQWKPLVLDEAVPMSEVPSCPADRSRLRTLCTLIERSGKRRVRIGCCAECGHVTYIDRPTKRWIDEYYRAQWDAHDLTERVDKRQDKLAVKLPKEKTGVKIAVGLPVDRSRPVCEIGCGYGANLKHLANAGFARLIGTESSVHRADVVRQVFGFEALTAPFESVETQQSLQTLAPFSIIFSHHVLEHTYHPDEVIAAASRLQAPGDFLIISVPNHEQEPSMGVLLFLPHLHSFTRESLERLAGRFGYELHDATYMHPKNVNLAFRRTDAVVNVSVTEGAFERAVAKYVRVLGLGRRIMLPTRLWWNRRADQAGHVWMAGSGRLEARHWARVARRQGLETHRSVKISGLSSRFTTVDESPLEIQFRDDLALMFK
jgi:2-polyprenyl-3-methyl-5-hydroxy-6-metoxy-1,4-benzoquinol methylase